MAGCGATGEQHIVLGKRIFLQCFVFCGGWGATPPPVPLVSVELHS